MVIKLDMANAFDRVRHKFLLDIMKMGFKETFIGWIEKCIARSWISPLINGRGVGFFQASRGLRQGCPLSPFLYILVREALSRNLEVARISHHIPRIRFKEGIKA